MIAADLRQYLPEDADYSITEEDHNRIWRAQHAATLLAALGNDVAVGAGISHDGPAAVADYIREELLDVLLSARHLRAPAAPPDSTTDLI